MYNQQGGLVPIQTEKGEYIAHLDGKITPVNAKKSHKRMGDEEVTDLLPEGTFIGSRDPKMKLTRKEASAIGLGQDPILYKEGEHNKVDLKEHSLADLFGSKDRKLTPAQLLKKLKAKYPLSKNTDMYAMESNRLNLQMRLPYIEALKGLNEMKKEQQGVDEYAEYGNMPQQAQFGPIVKAGRKLARKAGNWIDDVSNEIAISRGKYSDKNKLLLGEHPHSQYRYDEYEELLPEPEANWTFLGKEFKPAHWVYNTKGVDLGEKGVENHLYKYVNDAFAEFEKAPFSRGYVDRKKSEYKKRFDDIYNNYKNLYFDEGINDIKGLEKEILDLTNSFKEEATGMRGLVDNTTAIQRAEKNRLDGVRTSLETEKNNLMRKYEELMGGFEDGYQLTPEEAKYMQELSTTLVDLDDAIRVLTPTSGLDIYRGMNMPLLERGIGLNRQGNDIGVYRDVNVLLGEAKLKTPQKYRQIFDDLEPRDYRWGGSPTKAQYGLPDWGATQRYMMQNPVLFPDRNQMTPGMNLGQLMNNASKATPLAAPATSTSSYPSGRNTSQPETPPAKSPLEEYLEKELNYQKPPSDPSSRNSALLGNWASSFIGGLGTFGQDPTYRPYIPNPTDVNLAFKKLDKESLLDTTRNYAQGTQNALAKAMQRAGADALDISSGLAGQIGNATRQVSQQAQNIDTYNLGIDQGRGQFNMQVGQNALQAEEMTRQERNRQLAQASMLGQQTVAGTHDINRQYDEIERMREIMAQQRRNMAASQLAQLKFIESMYK